jgi:acyl-CoA dehydrogenase
MTEPDIASSDATNIQTSIVCSASCGASRSRKGAWAPAGSIIACATSGRSERALELMRRRSLSRSPFGKLLADQGVTRERVANARIMIEQTRLLCLYAADKMDRHGNKAARREIAMIKVAAPATLYQTVDWSIQAHGAAGVTPDFGLGLAFVRARVMRIVDGPDEVHRDQIGRMEINQCRN